MTLQPYSNEPVIDYSVQENKNNLLQALNQVKSEFGKSYPLWVGGRDVDTDNKLESVNPAKKTEVIGYLSQADKSVIDDAFTAANKAFESWSQVSFEERALYLIKAAAVMRRRKLELMACQIYESGKNWAEADGDVNEAIDFLEYYARRAMELGKGKQLHYFPGEDNSMMYLPMGVGVVIPPWNFPLAILTGTTMSAVVTGNTVLLKPAPQSSVMAAKFIEIMKEIQLPEGVINFVPGDPAEIGDYMTGHNDTRFVSFTGSKATGLHIDEHAHKQSEGQRYIKRVVAEMGGKDGIVVDETADLDAAAQGIIDSAFAFQGQKCSAGSRAIIHEAVFDELMDKVVEKAKAIKQGPAAENHFMGPVIDDKAFKKITGYIEVGKQEAKLLVGGNADDSEGYYVEPTIFVCDSNKARIMQEEIFGPVLAVVKVKDFEEGIRVFNDTEYGLTGAVFSKIRSRLEYARRFMMCGNLYFNRKCTGSLVGIQPFGGFNMSGTDAKAGGPDYLLNFVQPKTITDRF